MDKVELLSDEMLVERVSAKDSKAFSLLVERHHRKFYAVAYRVMLDVAEAEDVVQEAFCKLWHGKAEWHADRGAKFTTWFYRVVTNLALDMVAKRRRGSFTLVDEALPSPDISPEAQLMATRQSRNIHEVMEDLPERQRVAISLFYLDELSQKETADIMGITPKAVESLIGRAKQFLKERMMAYAE